MKVYKVDLIGGKRVTVKGKRLNLAVITGGAPGEKLSSKGTIKRKIGEVMVVWKNEGSSSPKFPNRPMLGVWDTEKIRGIPNEMFPW